MKFTDHCSTHDDSEYMQITSKKNTQNHSEKQVQTVGKPDIAYNFAKQIELASCVKIKEVWNYTIENNTGCAKSYIHIQTLPRKQ